MFINNEVYKIKTKADFKNSSFAPFANTFNKKHKKALQIKKKRNENNHEQQNLINLEIDNLYS